MTDYLSFYQRMRSAGMEEPVALALAFALRERGMLDGDATPMLNDAGIEKLARDLTVRFAALLAIAIGLCVAAVRW